MDLEERFYITFVGSNLFSSYLFTFLFAHIDSMPPNGKVWNAI